MDSKWDSNALTRHQQINSGIDITFSKVFLPIYESVANTLRPDSILEVGSGTGALGKALSKYSKIYVGIEPSSGMHALAVEANKQQNTAFHNMTVCALPMEDKFDFIIMHLVLHTTQSAAQILKDCKIRLNRNGLILFSIPHPCFYNNYKNFLGANHTYMARREHVVNFSISLDPTITIKSVPYIHRPISDYINMISDSNLHLKKLDEIFPSEEIQNLYPSVWSEPRYCLFWCESWCGYETQIIDDIQS